MDVIGLYVLINKAAYFALTRLLYKFNILNDLFHLRQFCIHFLYMLLCLKIHTLFVISRYNIQCYVIKTHTILVLTWYLIYLECKYRMRLFILVLYIIHNKMS